MQALFRCMLQACLYMYVLHLFLKDTTISISIFVSLSSPLFAVSQSLKEYQPHSSLSYEGNIPS